MQNGNHQSTKKLVAGSNQFSSNYFIVYLYKMDEVIDNEPKTTALPVPNENPVVPEGEVKPKKPRKPRKPMSEEHKAKCKESLAKAREASKKKRQKNAYVKKLKKKEDEKEKDDAIKAQILAEDSKDKEIEKLKKKLANLTLQDVLPKPKPKAKEEVLESIAEEATEEQAEQTAEPSPPSIATLTPKSKPKKKVEMMPKHEPTIIPEEEQKPNKTHTITKEKTSQLVKPQRRKKRRVRGMAKYGRN